MNLDWTNKDNKAITKIYENALLKDEEEAKRKLRILQDIDEEYEFYGYGEID